jgi:hypothetical protein
MFMKNNLLHYTLLLTLSTSSVYGLVQTPDFSKQEIAELVVAGIKGPVGTTLAHIENRNLKSKQIVRLVYDALSLSNAALSSYNRPDEYHHLEYLQALYDLVHAGFDLYAMTDDNGSLLELTAEDKEAEAQIKKMLRSFLPLVESIPAVYSAWTTTDKSDEARKHRCLAKAAESFVHYVNGYLNTSNRAFAYSSLGGAFTSLSGLIYYTQQDASSFDLSSTNKNDDTDKKEKKKSKKSKKDKSDEGKDDSESGSDSNSGSDSEEKDKNSGSDSEEKDKNSGSNSEEKDKNSGSDSEEKDKNSGSDSESGSESDSNDDSSEVDPIAEKRRQKKEAAAQFARENRRKTRSMA